MTMLHKSGRIRKFVKWSLLAIAAAGLSAILGSYIANRFLSWESWTPGTLSGRETVITAEAFRIKDTFGDAVWPDFGESGNTMLLFNKEYAFLLNYPDPQKGFYTAPGLEHDGGEWEPVSVDAPMALPVYRQAVANPEHAIGQFTVRVGERWVPSYYTREASIISLRAQIRDSLPPVLNQVFPYWLVQKLWITDWYIMGMIHESFHAYVGNTAESRIIEAERYASIMDDRYPWGDPTLEEGWKQELDCWMTALEAATREDTIAWARQALEQRAARRADAGISDELARGEHEREWLEGLAKYVELHVWREAAEDSSYEPLPAIGDDPDFKSYRTFDTRLKEELRLVRKQYRHHGDTFFYYSGLVQAMLLDRLEPDWKTRILQPEMYLDDMLREAIGG